MKKNVWMGILLISLVLQGCGVNQQTDGQSQLPDPSSFLVDEGILPTTYPDTASIYEVSFFEPDEQTAIKAFMRSEPTERLEWAEGPQYKAGENEYLSMYTGAVRGGLSYMFRPEETDEQDWYNKESWKNCATKELREAGVLYYALEDDAMLPYDQERDFQWKSQAGVIQNVEERMSIAGLPEMEKKVVLPRDAETLNHNLSIYDQALRETREMLNREGTNTEPYKPIEQTYTEVDEDYYIIYRQMIDSIPVADEAWFVEHELYDTNQSIHVLYSNTCGLEEARFINLYTVLAKQKEVAIISPEEALRIYAEDYDKAWHSNAPDVLSIELNYVVTQEDERMLAKPAWIIRYREKIQMDDGMERYDYFSRAVNAGTGMILQKVSDAR